jgi:gliding motility-associated-like protein
LKTNISLRTDNFIHTGINTRNANQYYYIQAVDSCGNISQASTIHKTIDLEVNIGQLQHTLQWTKYQGFEVKAYYVQRFNNGNFVNIDTLPATDSTNFRFPAPCNYHILYRITAVDKDGRTAYSDTMGRIAIDTIFANPAQLINTTINSATESEVNFRGSDSLDVYAYTIQRSKDGNWGTAGQVLFSKAGDDHHYKDTVNTLDQQLCYTVITLDSCLNASFSDTMCAVQLKGTALNLSNALSWHKFKGYNIDEYAVLVYNGSGWDTLTKTNNTDTSHLHLPLACNTPVTYKIAAQEANGSRKTLSDPITLTPFDTVPPTNPSLYSASVQPGGEIQLNWHWDRNSDVKYFEVWRDNADHNFKLIKTVVYDSAYIDDDPYIIPSKNAYSYYIIAVDSCNTNNRSVPSDTHTIIVPSASKWTCNPEVELYWSPYIGFSKNASKYNIYRSEDGNNYNKIAAVNFSSNSFTDLNIIENNKYFYRIEAADTLNGFTSFSDTISVIPRLYPEPDTAEIIRTTVVKTEANTGAVRVEWKRPNISDTLLRGYYLYYSTFSAAGPFTLLADIKNLNDTIFIHQVNTVDKKPFYRVVAYNACTFQGKDKGSHKSINLEVDQKNLQADLFWEPYIGFPIQQYELRRIEDKTTYKTIAVFNPQDTFYIDSVLRCGHEYAWQIIGYNYYYNLVTYSDSVWFTAFDTIAPQQPIIAYASVLTTANKGNINLLFNGNAKKNRNGYTIYRREANQTNFTQIATLPTVSTLNINWTDTAVNTTSGAVSYAIVATDSCGNASTLSATHTTVFLAAKAFDGYNQLNWSSYQGWKVKQYHIYRDGQKYFSVNGNTFSFKDSQIICSKPTYLYQIIAEADTSITLQSSSNTVDLVPIKNKKPKPVYLNTVSVSVPNKEVTLNWDASTEFDMKQYYIYMRSGHNGKISFIDRTTSLNYTHKRDTIDVSDCYFVHTVDYCGNISDPSNRGCIIILNGNSSRDLHKLNWNEYSSWKDGVNTYKIYKKNSLFSWTEIGATQNLNFNDNLLINDTSTNNCYQVEAIENLGSHNASSRSTIICLEQEPVVFVPNAFTPNDDSDNDKFGPKGAFIKSYSMEIYNRWGELVYQTHNSKPWDGSFKNAPVQMGVYMYIITVESFTPNGVQRLKGTVNVLK